MNIEKLAESLKPWMQVDTWLTTHPSDYSRFHQALKNAYEVHGYQIHYDDFKEAMHLLAGNLYPGKYAQPYLDEAIERFSSNAEAITSYHFDMKN
ncbi:hypothetical protein [Neptunomonas japonica]|uniref:hypothetical protein n=1 Tax=Neptunomonas japonica TaxID=417574 RepID=UPI00040A1165|nr:hypothetical protein [Neptunomonas japonica]